MSEEKTPIIMEEKEYEEYLKNQKEKSQVEVGKASLYELNKQIIASLPKMPKGLIRSRLNKEVAQWYFCFPKTPKYIVLLNHEEHYYTMFHNTKGSSYDKFKAELFDILTNYYGDNDIRAIDVAYIDEQPIGAVEIWGMWNGRASVAYLFPYDEGVIEF